MEKEFVLKRMSQQQKFVDVCKETYGILCSCFVSGANSMY